jgi:uncharacterized protein (TIGR03437 family)
MKMPGNISAAVVTKWLLPAMGLALIAVSPSSFAQKGALPPLDITMSLSGYAEGTFGAAPTLVSGSVIISPWGGATWQWVPGSTFIITYPDFGSLEASVALKTSKRYASGVATITSGTGTFQGVTGSFSFDLDCDGGCSGEKGVSFNIAVSGDGSGTVTGAPDDFLEGGYGAFAGTPIGGPGGLGDYTNCFTGAKSSNCTTAGSGTPSIPVYDTSDPNVSTQVDIWTQTETTAAGSQLQNTTNGVTESIIQGNASQERPHRGVAGKLSSSATAASAPASFNIITPIQSSSSTYTATPVCANAPTCWISVPVSSGSIAASSRAAITVVVSPEGLPPGVYTGSVDTAITSKSGAPSMLTTSVTAIVSAPSAMLALSQPGVQFQATAGSTAPQSGLLAVSNAGSGSMTFTATAATLSGGNWLSISAASGTAPADVILQAQPSGLAPGQYFGTVKVTAAGALNSPQEVSVVLTVLATPNGSAQISPSSLSFVAPASGNPSSQTVQVIDSSSETYTVSTVLSFAEGNDWFTATPSASTVSSTQPLTESVAVNSSGLAAGTYLGTLDIHVAETNADYAVPIQLVVPGPGVSSTCTPTQLLPAFINIAGGFSTPAGVPTPLQVKVTDDCGTALTSGSVVAYFPGSNDPAVSLTSIGSGQWVGAWMPHNLAGGAAEVGVLATSFTSGLYGSAGIAGTLSANRSVPLITPGRAVSAASFAANAPIAPGSYISIFGSNLAAVPQEPDSFPLQTTLGGTQVLLGGEPMPLLYAGPGQIYAMVPYDAVVNSIQQIAVVSNGALSLPETVVVAEAQPAVFTQDQSGTGAGTIMVAKPNGSTFLDTPATPASAGDTLVIYCSGLGPVSPAIAAGSVAPVSPASATTNPVTVTTGGKSAHVSFAGLAPGYAGLYEVKAVVPSGVSGATVPVVLSVAGASSPAVTVAIQ